MIPSSKYFRRGSFHHTSPEPFFIQYTEQIVPREWVSTVQSVKLFSVQNLTPFFPMLEGIWQRQWGNSKRSCVLRLRKLDSIPAVVSHCLPCKTGQILSLGTAGPLGWVSHFLGAQCSSSVAKFREMLSSYSCNRTQLELWFECKMCYNNAGHSKRKPKNKNPKQTNFRYLGLVDTFWQLWC